MQCSIFVYSQLQKERGLQASDKTPDNMYYLALFMLPVVMAQNTCGSAAINGLVGYATGTTGGGSGTGTTVTSCSALAAAAAKSGVIRISGILDACGITDLQSDTTVLGIGSGSGKYSLQLNQGCYSSNLVSLQDSQMVVFG